MKQDLVAAAVGVVLLGGLVAFAVLPGETAAEPAEPSPAQVLAERADAAGCRAALLSIARHPLTDVLDNIAQATEFERQRGDGGLVFDDWFEPDPAQEVLTGLSAELTAAGSTPGASDDFFEADLAVVEAAGRLLRAVDGTSVRVADTIDDARIDLVRAVAGLEEHCA